MHSTQRGVEAGRSFRAGALIGIGIMAAVDEIIFHQVLGWHHFYDRSTTEMGLLTDGLLHSAELILLVSGFFLLADLHRKTSLGVRRAWAGFLIGAGGFQLFDGLIDHKVLRLHQIRYGVELIPYDLLWNGAALLLILWGMVLYRKTSLTTNPA